MSETPDCQTRFVVRPQVPRSAAEKRLPIRLLTPPFLKTRIQKIELGYLPHYLFRVELSGKKGPERVEAAVDAVLGHFAIWQSEKAELVPAGDQTFDIPFRLGVEAAEARLREQYRWVLIARGLRRKRTIALSSILYLRRFYYPFWIGYYRARGKWNFEALDALAGMRQGGKVKDAFIAGWVNPRPTPETP